MRPRIKIGRFLVRFGKFVQSLALMVMKPDDLDEYTRQMYSRSNHVDAWSGDEILNRGLYPREEKYLEHIPVKKGSLLLLGVGGGREAIPMAERGFEVTGVDFVPEMVKRAEENALKKGLKINGSVQNISELNFPDSTFDIVWLSYNMYSGVPTRKKRIRMLKKINKILYSNGYFLCQFFWYSKPGYPKKIENLRKIFAYLTIGNIEYEQGDLLWQNREFTHAFASERSLRSEFREGGFKVYKMYIYEKEPEGAAILRKSSFSGAHSRKK